MAEYEGVMIHGEVTNDKLADDRGQELCAVLGGSGVSGLA